jgi:hypothetical protein
MSLSQTERVVVDVPGVPELRSNSSSGTVEFIMQKRESWLSSLLSSSRFSPTCAQPQKDHAGTVLIQAIKHLFPTADIQQPSSTRVDFSIQTDDGDVFLNVMYSGRSTLTIATDRLGYMPMRRESSVQDVFAQTAYRLMQSWACLAVMAYPGDAIRLRFDATVFRHSDVEEAINLGVTSVLKALPNFLELLERQGLTFWSSTGFQDLTNSPLENVWYDADIDDAPNHRSIHVMNVDLDNAGAKNPGENIETEGTTEKHEFVSKG